MVNVLNITDEAYGLMMLKTNRMMTAGSKRSNITCQKLLPFLMRQRTDRIREMETEFSKSHPPSLPKSQSFIQNLRYEQSLSANTNDPESFYCAIGPILALAQIFGVLPVSGICKPTLLKMQFVRFSFLTIYATFISGMVLVMAILSIIHMIKTLDSTTFEVHGGFAAATAGAFFYGNSVLSLILFFWLSPRWVILQRDWRSMEQLIDSNKVERPKLRWRFYAISGCILLLALVEHIFSIAVNSEKHDWRNGSKNATFENFLQIYCASSHAFILKIVEYNVALGIFIFIVSKLATFTWNFTDVFIMLVATGLAERYKVLNKEMMKSIAKHLRTRIDWSIYREDYATLSCMVKKVDNNIAPLILLSFANNLYFICLQLLNGLSQSNDSSIISDIYFFGSFIFLIGRTVTVTLLTSRINDQSKVALPALYTCSSSSYNEETERLIYLLTTDDIALTGMRFFSITRNFLLAVAGAIVTYEIVLLQFNRSTQN